MRKIGNILWHFPFFGFIDAIVAWFMGFILVITVVGAPIGLGLMQWSKFLLAPFSWTMVDKGDLNIEENKLWKSFGLIVRIIYFPFGLLLTVSLFIQIILLAISVVGIPMAIILAKSLSTAFNPVGKVCVPGAVSRELERRQDEKIANKYLNK